MSDGMEMDRRIEKGFDFLARIKTHSLPNITRHPPARRSE